MLLTITYSESACPIAPVEPLKAILYDYFGISVYSVYFIFISSTINLHMADSRVRNSDSTYSICYIQVF